MLMAALETPQIMQETKYRVLLYRESVRGCVCVEGNKMEAGEQLRIAGLPCVPRGEEEQEES